MTVLKDGVIVDLVKIGSKKSYLFGRDAERADHALVHSSCSRLHAALVHSHGCVYVADLGSSHGTRVNGRRLVAGRPVPLSDGDSFSFGASSRSYTLHEDGPPEGARERGTRRARDAGVSSPAGPLADEGPAAAADASSAPKRQHASSTPGGKSDPSPRTAKRRRTEEPAEGEERPRVYHILLKHTKSRRPWRRGDESDVVTRSPEDAEKKLRAIREGILAEAARNSRPVLEVFTKAAKKYSDCRSFRRGGDLGKIQRGQMDPPFERASFELAVGETSAVVHGKSGVHIVHRRM